MSLSTFPRRQLGAFSIAVGGLMHWIGLYQAYRADALGPWWVIAAFVFFGTAYPLSALDILRGGRPGLWIALFGPLVGSVLIFIGVAFPATGLMVFIPGTLTDELTVIGFITLVVEPIAVVLAAEMLVAKD
ncbi:MAG: hypothetical protein AAF657_09500 [Acidobacteriota bacterium]